MVFDDTNSEVLLSKSTINKLIPSRFISFSLKNAGL